MTDLTYISIGEAHDLLVAKKVGAVELIQFYLDRIQELDSKIGACLTVCADEALAGARKVDAKLANGDDIGLLEGIPYTAKDMFLTKGIRTTAASKILDSFIPPFSATVIEKLDAAGAILIAKTNQDEYGHGGSTENSGYQVTHNPWDTSRVPGGSSGGSAAAVAAGFGIFSLGTDTGGSSRQPAAYCGVTGYKPTYGSISRYGVVAMASSFDTIGVIAHCAEDVAKVVEVIEGRDARDATTIETKFDANTEFRPQGKKVGVIKEYIEQLGQANKAVFTNSLEELKALGLSIVEVSIPDIAHALPAYYVLVPSEISSNLSRYDGIRFGHSSEQAHNLREVYDKSRDEGFGPEAKRRIMTGTYALSAGYYDAYYKKAMQIRTQLIEQFTQAFDGQVALVGPTTPAAAFKFGANAEPVDMYLADIMTVAANLTGIPAISIPSGYVDSMPVGLQLLAPQRKDGELIGLASAFQAQTVWHDLAKKGPRL